MGECQKYVICPGIVPRVEMAQKVKEDYRKLTPDITYLYSPNKCGKSKVIYCIYWTNNIRCDIMKTLKLGDKFL